MKKSSSSSRIRDEKADGLHLPVMREPLPRARALSMDDYLQFCLDNLRDCADSAAIERRRKRFPAPVQFRLKDL